MQNKQSNKSFIVLGLSLAILFSNIAPIFAQTIEIQIIGAGYSVSLPANISLPTVNTSTNEQTGETTFRDLSSTINYALITDENGGNPFDVIVTGGRLTKTKASSLTTTGSSGANITMVSSNSFVVGDIIIIEDYARLFKITDIVNNTTVTITPTPTTPPAAGKTIETSYNDNDQSINCMYFSKACLPYQNISFKSNDSDLNTSNDVIAINGLASDFQLITTNYLSFGTASTTIAGSNGNQLKVTSSADFIIGDQIQILEPNYDFTTPGCDVIPCSPTIPTTYTISDIIDSETIEVSSPPSPLDGTLADLIVHTPNSRVISVGRGNGHSPGNWKLSPSIKIMVPKGQNPGNYNSYITFTIV